VVGNVNCVIFGFFVKNFTIIIIFVRQGNNTAKHTEQTQNQANTHTARQHTHKHEQTRDTQTN